MTATHETVRPSGTESAHDDSVASRLLDSSAQLSYDPQTEVDWETPLDPADHGASPEWSTLYGTKYWAEMSEAIVII